MANASAQLSGRTRVGIGGWNFAEWRAGVFYPPGLPQAEELEFASRHLTSIEINSTFYTAQKPAIYARWRDQTPEGFQFSLKAHRLATQRRRLSEGTESVVRFLESGITELGAKLGPIVWQLAPYYAFDADDLEYFLSLLPNALDGLPLRHVLEPRHESFACAEYVRLARAYGVATVYTDSPDYPNIADVTSDFVYARLMRSQADEPTGYSTADLSLWARRAQAWRAGGTPEDLPLVVPEGGVKAKAKCTPRDVFIYFISAAKARNPAAAQSLIARLQAG
ncbi:DUF72 domain-containing protein [Ottowia thiooxydans]|uniref:Uncharacterized protein YecE (DUF72 family) n=1 Tax=Ottowia thiooxydans TaxID=219182 RepID=A0ABV2Q7W6_9BURK